MTTQPEALRLADALSRNCYDESLTPLQAAHELRRLQAVNQELLEALKLAVRQNEHDMLMTGEELRICDAAIARAEGQA
jgi:hypothetical protein